MGILKKIWVSLGFDVDAEKEDYLTGYDVFLYCQHCMVVPNSIYRKPEVCPKCGERLVSGVGRVHIVTVDKANHSHPRPDLICMEFLPKETGADNKANDKQG